MSVAGFAAAGALAGAGEGLADVARQLRAERFAELRDRRRAAEAEKDREFRSSENETNRGFQRESQQLGFEHEEEMLGQRFDNQMTLAERRAVLARANIAASRGGGSDVVGQVTGEDGNLYNKHRDGSVSPVTLGDEPFKPASTSGSGGQPSSLEKQVEYLAGLYADRDGLAEPTIEHRNEALTEIRSGTGSEGEHARLYMNARKIVDDDLSNMDKSPEEKHELAKGIVREALDAGASGSPTPSSPGPAAPSGRPPKPAAYPDSKWSDKHGAWLVQRDGKWHKAE